MDRNERSAEGRKKTPLRFVAFALALLLLFMIPVAVMYGIFARSDGIYSETYYGALAVKYDRLYSLSSPKTVVIGGSGTAFGIDSELVSRELGEPCVNFGLYAALGLKCMLDLSLDALGSGDTVIISPEYSRQMFSDYVGYEYLLQACDGRTDMLRRLGLGYAAGAVQAMPGHLSKRSSLEKNGGVAVSGVYARASFDETGNMIFPRPHNIMDGGYSADNIPELDASVVTDGFADMINRYVAAAKRRGAAVYFGFCPVNVEAVSRSENADIKGFISALESKLACPILSDLESHIMDAGYFYDSNFHMNGTGMRYNTVLLIDDLKRVRGDLSPTSVRLPRPPAVSGDEVISSGTADGFTYDITSAGAVITGLDGEGKTAKVLTVPEKLEDAAVVKIGAGAFADCAAKKIVLPSCISAFGSAPFSGAASLELIELHATAMPSVGDTLLDGAPSSAVIAVPKQVYGVYLTDYFWARYGDRLTELE